MESRFNDIATQHLKLLLSSSTIWIDRAVNLIKAGADPRVVNPNGKTFLHILVDHIEMTRSTISELVSENWIDINITDADGRTPLQCLLDSLPAILYFAIDLIHLGADTRVLNSNGDSILHFLAERGGHADAICLIERLVMRHKADINIKNQGGKTPLQMLLKNTFSAEDAMRLVRLKANVKVFNSKGQSLLHILSCNMNKENKSAVRELVKEHRVDINMRNADGCTPLQELVKRPFKMEDADYLIRLGADVDQPTLSLLKRKEEIENLQLARKNSEASKIIQSSFRCYLAKQRFFNRINEVVERAESEKAATLTLEFMETEDPAHPVLELQQFKLPQP